MIIRSLRLNAVFTLLLTAVSAPAVLAQDGVAEAGQTKAAVCAACHGQTGNDGPLPNMPKLGGQGERYLFKQLQDIKTGVRVVPEMLGIVAPLSEQDLADLSAYFASLPAPQGAADPARRELGERLYRAGDAALGVAACSACHLPNGKGNHPAGYPALSGQDAAYTELELKAFRAGERTNDEAEVMRTIAARLNDAEIAALASYISGLR